MARILLAEESPAHRALSRKTLLAGGHEIVEATTAAETLARLADGSIDVIVLDTALPDATPEEVVDAIRNTADLVLIPIIQTIAETAPIQPRKRWFKRAEQPVIRSALSEFAIERLQKPFTPHRLTEAVTKALVYRAEIGADLPQDRVPQLDASAIEPDDRQRSPQRW